MMFAINSRFLFWVYCNKKTGLWSSFRTQFNQSHASYIYIYIYMIHGGGGWLGKHNLQCRLCGCVVVFNGKMMMMMWIDNVYNISCCGGEHGNTIDIRIVLSNIYGKITIYIWNLIYIWYKFAFSNNYKQ